MKKKTKYQTIIITTCLLLSMLIIGIQQVNENKSPIVFSYVRNSNNIGNSYFIDDAIPGIVDGTAKIFDTNEYFEKHDIEKNYAKARIVSNNISNLKISIGYKPTDFNLLEVPNIFDGITTKEITLWERQNTYPTSSINLSLDSMKEEVYFQWDLKSIGFNTDEFVNANERIWYLKINRLDNNSLGEYIEHTIIEDDETFTYLDYEPYISYLESFEIQYDNLVFNTLLHPFFDGTTEIVVPIRGVNHELSIIEEEKKQTTFQTLNANSWEENESHSGSKDRWAVVWACSCDETGMENTRKWVPVESCAFILGCSHEIDDLDEWQYYGIYDYGWNIAYCMDEAEPLEHPLKTCTTVTDEYFEAMMGTVDAYLGSNDELIVFTHSHGYAYKSEHYTITDESSIWLWYLRDSISCKNRFDCASYYNEIDDITEDGTYVFLYTKACQSNANDSQISTGINTFPSNKHNNRLLTWSYHDYATAHGTTVKYSLFKWTTYLKATGYLFKWSYDGYNLTTISNKIENDNDYCGHFHPKDDWNQYQFKLKIPFTIENFDLFYQLEDNDYITSTHTNTQIQFSFDYSGTSGTWLTESYFLKFPETSANYYVEITADWSVGTSSAKWESLLEVGMFDYATTSFDALASIGTNDIYGDKFGRFQAMFNDYWYYDTDLNEVQMSRTNVKYIISYTNGQFWCRIKQGTTTLFQLVASTSGGYSINAIQLLFKHEARIYSSKTSTWTIKDIYAEINY